MQHTMQRLGGISSSIQYTTYGFPVICLTVDHRLLHKYINVQELGLRKEFSLIVNLFYFGALMCNSSSKFHNWLPEFVILSVSNVTMALPDLNINTRLTSQPLILAMKFSTQSLVVLLLKPKTYNLFRSYKTFFRIYPWSDLLLVAVLKPKFISS